MHAVVSTNVRKVGYDSSTRTMRVEFKSSRVYDYLGVSEDLYRQMLQPHPWRRLRRQVLTHTAIPR